MSDLKAFRKTAGEGGKKISQGEAARLFGVSLRAWQYWESGQRAFPPQAAILLRVYQQCGTGLLG